MDPTKISKIYHVNVVIPYRFAHKLYPVYWLGALLFGLLRLERSSFL